MLFLCTETAFEPGESFPREFTPEDLPHLPVLCSPSLAYKGCGYPIFVQNFLLALLVYMESVDTHLTLTFISFWCIRIQSFRRIPSLNALKEMCPINEIPSVCMYVARLCTEFDRFCLLAPYDRAYVMTVNTDNTVTGLPAFKHLLFLYKNLSDYGKPFLIILCIFE